MGCLTDCLKCCTAGLGVLILLAATLGISITNIVLGATNLNSNCTGIDQIPVYLITSGVLGLVAVLVKGSDNDNADTTEGGDGDKKKKKQKKSSQFLQLIQLASLGVQIWGSVILYNVDRPECDRVLYDYAFAFNITAYAILAVILLISCCAFSVICCEACADKCCGDGEGECKYHCTCCGQTCCADDMTNAELHSTKQVLAQQQTNTTPSVVIEMPPIKNIATTSHIVSEC